MQRYTLLKGDHEQNDDTNMRKRCCHSPTKSNTMQMSEHSEFSKQRIYASKNSGLNFGTQETKTQPEKRERDCLYVFPWKEFHRNLMSVHL